MIWGGGVSGLTPQSGRTWKCLWAAVLFPLVGSSVAHAQAPTDDRCERVAATYNYVLGTQAIGAHYQFSEDSALIEQAREIRRLGSNLLKISLGRGAAEGYGTDRAIRGSRTVLDYLQASQDLQQALDMDFTHYQMWVPTYTGGEWSDGVSRSEAQAYYSEMYQLAEWLLTRYSGTGKVFMLGNWEGDWLLHGRGRRDSTPSQRSIDGMIDWLNIRQQAIDDAKANVPNEGVELYHYVEVNLVQKAMRGEASVAHSVLPNTNVDLVSYSSYEAIKRSEAPDIESIRTPLTEAIEYLEGQLQPKEGLPFTRRVFLGEYGYHANRARPQSVSRQFLKSRYVMQVALELDLPFALIWQMYNNEYGEDGRSREMSLIDESGQRRALYFLHQRFLAEMRAFVTESCRTSSGVPSREAYRMQALELLPTLSFEDMQRLADDAH